MFWEHWSIVSKNPVHKFAREFTTSSAEGSRYKNFEVPAIDFFTPRTPLANQPSLRQLIILPIWASICLTHLASTSFEKGLTRGIQGVNCNENLGGIPGIKKVRVYFRGFARVFMWFACGLQCIMQYSFFILLLRLCELRFFLLRLVMNSQF